MTDEEIERLGWLQTMTAQSGWRIYADAIDQQVMSLRDKTLGAGTPDEDRGKYAEAFRAVRDALEWPYRETDRLMTKANQGDGHG